MIDCLGQFISLFQMINYMYIINPNNNYFGYTELRYIA